MTRTRTDRATSAVARMRVLSAPAVCEEGWQEAVDYARALLLIYDALLDAADLAAAGPIFCRIDLAACVELLDRAPVDPDDDRAASLALELTVLLAAGAL